MNAAQPEASGHSLDGYKVGWYQIARSRDVKAEAVLTLQAFGQEFVLFRTKSGQAAIFDPQCPHLGAHLGQGCVSGDALQCCFHGWKFGTDGQCREIPYSDRVPSRARVRSWRLCESYGNIYLYYAPSEEQPAFQVPEIPHFTTSEWLSPYRNEAIGALQPYDLFENAVDMGHFSHIHGFKKLPITDAKIRQHVLRVEFESRVSYFGRDVPVKIWSELHGPGISINHIESGIELFSFLNPLPINQHQSRVYVTNFLRKSTVPVTLRQIVPALFALQFMYNLRRDMRIFSRRVNPAVPVLCAGDGPVIQYRRWFSALPDYDARASVARFCVSQRKVA
jgi:phenylpropionate dioxygenase-like ring-hydroxylating dioxygenase large terminal subunit